MKNPFERIRETGKEEDRQTPVHEMIKRHFGHDITTKEGMDSFADFTRERMLERIGLLEAQMVMSMEQPDGTFRASKVDRHILGEYNTALEWYENHFGKEYPYESQLDLVDMKNLDIEKAHGIYEKYLKGAERYSKNSRPVNERKTENSSSAVIEREKTDPNTLFPVAEEKLEPVLEEEAY